MNANIRFQAASAGVMQLDLSAIKTKLMHAASGEGWSRQKADAVEQAYRRFLCLMATYPDESIAPLVDVDTFWHYHILDTMKYAADCQQAFGYFMHHYPYVGLRGGDDEQVRLDSGERMRTLYEITFGEAITHSFDDAPAVQDTVASTWCAGPGAVFASAQAAAAASAWCAGPGAKAAAQSAWCAGPGAKTAGLSAWCAGPGAKVSFRASGAPAGRHAGAAQDGAGPLGGMAA